VTHASVPAVDADDVRPPLTDRQQQLLNAIRLAVVTHGIPPTIRQLAQQVGVASTSTIKAQLDALAAKGYIDRDPTGYRTLRLADQGPPAHPWTVGVYRGALAACNAKVEQLRTENAVLANRLDDWQRAVGFTVHDLRAEIAKYDGFIAAGLDVHYDDASSSITWRDALAKALSIVEGHLPKHNVDSDAESGVGS
jgi:LexA DNA binding domain